jgi:hypothetical protein
MTVGDGGPPRRLVGTVFALLTALLVFPIHVPYQNPDQDLPIVLSLLELVRGGWEPSWLPYPSGLTNLLRGASQLALAGAHAGGMRLDALDLLAAWYRNPAPFRAGARVVAMAAGVVSLVAVMRLARLVTDRWSALFAATVLGTSLMFVREHHYGMWDAPMSAAVIGSLALCGRYVARPSALTIVAAGATAGLAFAFKYNALVALGCPLVAVAVAVGPGSVRAKARAGAFAVGASALAVLVASPALFLEPARVAAAFRLHAQLFQTWTEIRRRAAVPYGIADVLRNGLGVAFVGAAVVGAIMACVRRERAVLPLVVFALGYAVVISRYPVALNRYALPFAPVGAVLVAYALHRGLPLPWRAIAAVGLIAIGLPSTVAYVALLAKEDTRVASARWLRAHVRPDARVFFSTDAGGVAYVGPDLPRPFEPYGTVPLAPATERELLARMGPSFPRTWRFIGPGTMFPNAAADADPSGWANGIVVTSDVGAYPFAPYDTPPAAIRFLEQHAILLQDYPIERRPGVRVYEQVDMNYIPLRGAATLERPGPRIRIWYVPPDRREGDVSPFLRPEDEPQPLHAAAPGG